MFGYIVRRLIATAPVMLIVAVLVFLMLRLTPGDPAAIIAGDNANAEQIAAIRTRLGLDEPIVTQFFIWLGNLLRGDFGESFFFKKTVAELVASESASVGSSRLAISSATVFLKKNDSPKSPCNMLAIQMKNWVKMGSSRPRRFRISAICSLLALSPAMIAAGSPGVSRSIRNTSTATMIITGTVAASLRRT